MSSFLENRIQRVKIGPEKSLPALIESGVPQGGVLSGLLFNLYVNDMSNIFSHVKTSLYADDAKLYAPIDNRQCISSIQADLDALADWCGKWRLRLNTRKCFFLHYVPQNTRDTNPSYHISDDLLPRKDTAIDLGITVKNNLKFHEQVAVACKKATNQINIIRRSFVSRNPKFLENMWKTYVRPHLEHCVQTWNPVYAGDISAIEKVQDRITRLLPQSALMTPEDRNRRLSISSHETRRLRGDLIFIFKLMNSEFFTLSTEGRTRGHSKKLRLERSRNNLRKHSFAVRNVAAWNSLPESIVSAYCIV